MPERAINTRSATGFMLVLIPAALTMSALFVAWPIILGVTLAIAGGNIWQNYEWSKTTRSIDPVFQELIIQNRGEITSLDLSLNANISGAVSNRYLTAKASEFGTGSRQHPDLGQVYYFVTVSTLGRIFDDSELEPPAIMPATTPVAAFEQVVRQPELAVAEVVRQPEANSPIAELSQANLPPPVETTFTPVVAQATQIADVPDETAGSSDPIELPDRSAAAIVAEIDREIVPDPAQPQQQPPANSVVIIQSELAKRLDVHSSTIYKRRSEENFTDWTRNRDPEGIAWGYAEATKEYYQVNT
ncbi:hypothetical protein [Chamaesiphon sp. GL140_3_metabinner_50]|uniref:hypothetical protein n=1 Tax=Chamaesiphon sp. GL140_3_metabinner_50 TaxID=2970812 RepID=UPI0025E573A6|nr:hypothetical protein [Chamaesiphon sp. GL140_3_metabinner_50]